MENQIDLIELLDYIDPAALEYSEWLKVGMALKEEGYSVDDWDAWSRSDDRYEEGCCHERWNTFNRHDLSGAFIVMKAKESGWSPARQQKLPKMIAGKDKWSATFSWEDDDLEEPEKPAFSEPERWNPERDAVRYLEAMFEPGDYVGYTMRSSVNSKGKYVPVGNGTYYYNAGQLIDQLNEGMPIEKVFGSYNKEAGAWIRINPLDGGGVEDANVAEFKYILVESDNMPVEDQIEVIKTIQLPVTALVYSGGKSVHALVRVDATSKFDYRQKFNFIKNVCKDAGMEIDDNNKNPSRLSRLPGCWRGEHKQFLIDTHLGMASFAEWKEWVSGINDGLPEIVNLKDVWDKMPPLKPELIEGILRQSHKMIVASTSKAGKTFILIELAVAIAEGMNWIGHRCKQGKVLYINMELDAASFFHRIQDIYKKLKLTSDNHIENIEIWNLRGVGKTLTELAPIIINRMKKRDYLAVMIDPLYKVMEGDENSNGDVARMVSGFDRIAEETGAAVIYAHHFAKGNSAAKSIIDRAAGAGTFARDPDAILTMTQIDWAPEIEAEKGWTAWRVESTLREFKSIDPVDLFFDWPIHKVDYDGRLADSDLLSTENNKRTQLVLHNQRSEIFDLIEMCEQYELDGIRCIKRQDFLEQVRKTGAKIAEGSIEKRLKEAGFASMKPLGYKGFWCNAEDL